MNNIIEKLAESGEPSRERGLDMWSGYEQNEFTAEDIPQLIEVVTNKDLHNSDKEGEYWAPLHAWRTLACLNATEAIEPLIGMLNFLADMDEDWGLDEIPMVMGVIGKAAISPLSTFLHGKNNYTYARVAAADGMRHIVEKHPECRSEVLNEFQRYISNPDSSNKTLNGLCVSYLIDIEAIELIDDIRVLYQKNYAEISMAGDIEDVEIELGLRKTRDTPKPRYIPEGINEDFLDLLQGKVDYSDTPPIETVVHETKKVGRNEPCPCGSGKKYKKCCLLTA